METIHRKKYPFWSKRGKPSSIESEVLNNIKDIAKQHNISEDAIVQKYGLANDIDSLKQMFGFIQNDIQKKDETQVQVQVEQQQKEPIEQTQQPKPMQNQSEIAETDATIENKNNNIPPDPDHYGAQTAHRSYAGGTNSKETSPDKPTPEANDTGKAGRDGNSEPISDIPESGPNIGRKEINEDRVKFGAESYVQGYNEIVLGFGKMFSQFSVRKLKKLHRNKQIDMKYPMEFEDGSKQSIEDYCEEFNQDVDEKLVPDPDKDARITHALIEVMKKHNHEPAPEQVLLQEVLYDLKEKVKAIVELAATKSDTLDFFIESHTERMEALKNSNNDNNNNNSNNNNGKPDEGITPTETVN